MVTESPPRKMPQPTLSRQAQSTDCQQIDREEYVRLLTSTKTLVRADDPASLTRGLFDPDTGIRYVIPEGSVFKN